MHVEGSKTWHAPHCFRQYTECHHYLQVGFEGFQLSDELGVAHLYGLQYGNVSLYGITLHRRWLQHRTMTAYRLVGLCDHCHHLISFTYEFVE